MKVRKLKRTISRLDRQARLAEAKNWRSAKTVRAKADMTARLFREVRG